MRILVVEDDEKLAKSLKRGLEQYGYAVDYVTDGEVAERRIELCSSDYDLIIMDIMLPKKSGIEICKNIRNQNITTPVLMLTGKTETSDKVAALDEGADDYLIKPFSLDELVARVRALLRRPPQAIPVELKVKDISLNTATRKVMCSNREIGLTVKEFALLEYLMRHPNQVVNRNQILDHLWGFDFDSFSNVVDVHIKNLRKKINNSKKRVLETVRGIGYKIRA